MFCGIRSCNTCSNAVLTQPNNRLATRLFIFIAPSMIRCLKSAQKSAVQVCQVATVVIETTQLVLSRFKIAINGELNKVSLCQK